MKSYLNHHTYETLTRSQYLSSLVINTPYSVDRLNTAPKISKIFAFPFGLRIESVILLKFIFNLIISFSIFMVLTCIFIICLYLPIQYNNNILFNNIKSLSNQKLINIASLQETSSLDKLFSCSSRFSLKDPDEIIHINNDINCICNSTKNNSFNNYPSLQFAGF